MELIKPQGNVQMVLPLDAYENDAMIKELVIKGAFLGLKSEQVLDNGVPKIQILLNFIEDDLANYIIANYQLNWLKCTACAYVELPKETDTKDLYIYDSGYWENDTNKLIRIYKFDSVLKEPTQTELSEWNKLGDIICNPVNVSILKKKYLDSEIS